MLDVDPEVFQRLVKWIYSQDLGIEDPQRLNQIPRERKNQCVHLQQELDKQDMHLVCLWVLAERFLMPRVQNLAMVYLYQRRKASVWIVNAQYDYRERTSIYRPSSHWIPYVFENASPDSLLYAYALHQAVFFIDAETFIESPEHFPRDLLLNFAIFVTKRRWPRLNNRLLGQPPGFSMHGDLCSPMDLSTYLVQEDEC